MKTTTFTALGFLAGCLFPALASASVIWDFTVGLPGDDFRGTGHIELASLSGSGSADVISFGWSGSTYGVSWTANETNINTVSWNVDSTGRGFDSFRLQTYNVHAASFLNLWLTISYSPSNNVAYSQCWDTLYTAQGYRCDGYSDNIAPSHGITSSSLTLPTPVPAAAWLFGSGLLGLVGLAQRKRAA